MAPYDESRTVSPYMIHVDRAPTQAMADHYKVLENDLKELRPKLQDWFGRPGGIDEFGLFTISNDNPFGKWDWYEIGGRWDGHLYGRGQNRKLRPVSAIEYNTIPVANFLRSKAFAKRLPCAIVTPTGEWIARSMEIGASYGWFLWELSSKEWAKRVRRVLRAFPNHRIVCVDAHS